MDSAAVVPPFFPAIICACARILFATFILSSHAQAADVTVYTENFPPYNYPDDNGRVVGLSTENVRKIMEAAGVDYEIRLLPWSRAEREANSNPRGLIYSTVRTPERAALYDWIALVAKPDFYLFARGDDTRPVTREAIVRGDFKAVCAATDASCSMLRQAGFREESLFQSDVLGLTETIMIRYNRVDLYLGDLNHHPFRMKELGMPVTATRAAMPLESEVKFYLAAGLHVDVALRNKLRAAGEKVGAGLGRAPSALLSPKSK